MYQDAHQFMTHFSLHAPEPVQWPQTHVSKLMASAVLIPLLETDQGLQVVLTRRTPHLRHHANQICFPGGRHDKTDGTLLETALRETEEELGIPRQHIRIIGELPGQPVLTRFMIQPYIAFVSSNAEYRLQTDEVAEVFHAPVKQLLDQSNHLQFKRQHPIYPVVHFIPFEHYLIWGATAAIIRRLADQMNPAGRDLYRPVL